jgi:nicotinamide mononucleotide transporter
MSGLNYMLFTIGGYSLSILELAGVVTGLLAVLLAAKEKSVNFIVGMINNACFFLVFFQHQLYSVMLLQVVYFLFSLYGFYHWKHPAQDQANEQNEQRIRFLSHKDRWVCLGVVTLAGLGWGWAVINGQARFPAYFDPPAYPWLDAWLTMASVAGQWMLARKYGDNWPLWIIVDLISTGLYASMGMIFTALMYGIFT